MDCTVPDWTGLCCNGLQCIGPPPGSRARTARSCASPRPLAPRAPPGRACCSHRPPRRWPSRARGTSGRRRGWLYISSSIYIDRGGPGGEGRPVRFFPERPPRDDIDGRGGGEEEGGVLHRAAAAPLFSFLRLLRWDDARAALGGRSRRATAEERGGRGRRAPPARPHPPKRARVVGAHDRGRRGGDGDEEVADEQRLGRRVVRDELLVVRDAVLRDATTTWDAAVDHMVAFRTSVWFGAQNILFHSIPFHSIPFHSIPFEMRPANHSIPFRSAPFHLASSSSFVASILGLASSRSVAPWRRTGRASCTAAPPPTASRPARTAAAQSSCAPAESRAARSAG